MLSLHQHKPIPSMYGIFPYSWLIFVLNVGNYTIHGSHPPLAHWRYTRNYFEQWSALTISPSTSTRKTLAVPVRTSRWTTLMCKRCRPGVILSAPPGKLESSFHWLYISKTHGTQKKSHLYKDDFNANLIRSGPSTVPARNSVAQQGEANLPLTSNKNRWDIVVYTT